MVPRHSSVLPALSIYVRDIKETALLNAEEEADLSEQIQGGDTKARDRMVCANLRLVIRIARTYTGKGLGLEDLIEEGNLGLLRAVEGFDGNMNTRFSTYASWWIKQSIKRALVNTRKTIRLPAYMVELLAKWHKVSSKLHHEFGRPATQVEIAKALNLPNKKLTRIMKAIRVYNTDPQTEQTEMLVDGQQKSPELKMILADDLKRVIDLLQELETRQAMVLRMRFGLIEDREPMTLKEIGESLDLTRERVRQIENEALARLAERMAGAS